MELGLQEIPFRAQLPIALSYKGHPLKQRYIADVSNGSLPVAFKWATVEIFSCV